MIKRIILFLLFAIPLKAQWNYAVYSTTPIFLPTDAALLLSIALPDTTGHSSQFLKVLAGGGYGWATASGGGGSGTVTSITLAGNNGISISGTNPITSSGTVNVNIANGSIGDSSLHSTFLKTFGIGNSLTSANPYGLLYVNSSNQLAEDSTHLAYDPTGFALRIGAGGTVFPRSLLSIYGNTNNYIQSNIQNLSSGTSASSDFVVTANDGTDSTNYGDFGINSSGYSNSSYFPLQKPHSVYLYSNGSSLVMGTAVNDSIIFHTNGTLAANKRMSIDGSGIVTIQGLGSGAMSTNSTGVISSGTLTPALGGTGFSTYVTGDLIYSSATNTLSKLAIGTTNQVLQVVGGAPS